MKTYYTAGTVGDTYVILCKLYHIAERERILCRHYTSHVSVRPIIKEVFSLLPNIQVEMLMEESTAMEVSGTFGHKLDKEATREYGFVPEYYPVFEPVDVKRFGLPTEYEVLQVEAGTANRKIRLPQKILDNIIGHTTLPLVVIGDRSFGVKDKNMIDLGGKTTVSEAIAVIRNSKHFYGRLGFLCFVAVSQKVPSSVEISNEAYRIHAGLTLYTVGEWEKFIVERL